ncbi:uncharacterized protein PHALS_13152 [Plasmopara halstedii]|uniref:Uncharacterized protein n=1 Tax=Plasmopara halstedii TaxID=4781 RepID=A0A0P1ANT5_PLAHL|nr:uncharacterized protein PHALS_13152 [Plasmopara halstedii]CEG42917.1 hypothetical protein PHALS_13152 [Plasmopara halstedii]|eukprot:XP_024579286.1 hypothetical protein PHALS_13152 [Plasmopara halstedii]
MVLNFGPSELLLGALSWVQTPSKKFKIRTSLKKKNLRQIQTNIQQLQSSLY